MIKFKRMKDIAVNETVRDMIPSADVFHRFLYYIESNYEELISSVRDLYSEKPDIDWAINPLCIVKNNDEARKFRRSHEGEINWPMLSVKKGKWSLFGPYKENRDRLDFYGSNMQLFEEMFNKKEKDAELGAQLMMRRKKKKKKKQELKVGPIDKKINAGLNPTTNISQFPGDLEDDIKEYDDDDKEVIVEVIKMKHGGLITESTEFVTEYDASVSINQ